MQIKCKIPSGNGLIVDRGEYLDGSKALQIMCDDDFPEPWCTLTVNMEHGPLEENHYLVKTWSENAETAHMLLDQGIFEDTGVRVPNGYVEAEIWKLKE